jgi:hypothetical protein
MTKNHTLITVVSFGAAFGAAFLLPMSANAQRGTDPNMGHFYMARQQVTITDDGPLINNKMQQAAPPGAQGALPPGVQQGLPTARWSQYAPTENAPSLSTSLPKVVNGVPPKMAPGGPAGQRGKAGKLGLVHPKGPATPVAKAPQGPATYAPYKQFSPEAAITGASDAQSSGNVKGDVLHWARRAHQGL